MGINAEYMGTLQYLLETSTQNMLRLLALTVVVSAAPQLPGYGYFNQQRAAVPFQREYPLDEATARWLINFGVFQRVTGTFKTKTATEAAAIDASNTAAFTVEGDVAWYQNPFTGDNSKYRVTIKEMDADTDYVVMLQEDCKTATTTGTSVKTGTAPDFQLFDSFSLRGTSTTHNIDGDDSKTKVTDLFVVVRKSSTTGLIIGCTAAKLA